MTDDSSFVQATLNRGDRLKAGKYGIAKTIRIDVTTPTSGLALDWSGVEFVSAITDGPDVLEISSICEFRGLRLNGLKITGNGKEGRGICIQTGAGAFIEKFALRDVVVEAVGGDGICIAGNVFQGQLYSCCAQDCLGNGLVFQNALGGICSAITIFGGSFDQNGLNGIATPYPDGPYDISILGTYCRDNKQAGMSFGNGFKSLMNCGLENNWQSAVDFAHGDAGIISSGGGLMIACAGSTNAKQTHLIRAYLPQDTNLTMICCNVQSESPPDLTPIKLANLSGPGAAATLNPLNPQAI